MAEDMEPPGSTYGPLRECDGEATLREELRPNVTLPPAANQSGAITTSAKYEAGSPLMGLLAGFALFAAFAPEDRGAPRHR